ncbi:hypothetical protein ACFOHP_22580 [Couchioplanes caeruleus subsp. azureus]|uniref:hypothetical protein n=1 Tax=Couchioplanes caeruleus TaxID=56438 RepID=UPI00361ED996
MTKKTHGHAFDKKGRLVITDETFNPRKGSLDFEGTTKRRFGLGDSIRTFMAGR